MNQWFELVIEKVVADDGIKWSHELKSAGLRPDIDYTWEYKPSKYDWFTGDGAASMVKFRFVNESLATYYRLKWKK